MYGVVTTVPAPVEMYDRMHAELIKRAGRPSTASAYWCTSGVRRPTASSGSRYGSPRSTTTAPWRLPFP